MREARIVAVVIPSWNSAGLLPRCIESLVMQDIDLELLVVDNGSTDGSVAYLAREGVRHVALPENIGFAAGWRFEYVPEAVVWHAGNASWLAGFERPNADNARLVARNRLATQVKFMPPSAIPRIAAVEVGSLLRAARQHRFVATLRGKLSALCWLRSLIGERRRLRRRGDVSKARLWLGAR